MRGDSTGSRRDVRPSAVEFVGLLRALGKAVSVYGVSHAQLERRLCSWIMDGFRAQAALDGSSGESREDLERQVSRMREVQESRLARADGQHHRAGGQRIGELLAGKSALHRKRVEVCVAVLLSFLEEQDPRGCRDGEYGTAELWHQVWQEAIQGRMPRARMGSAATTVQGYLDEAQRELRETGYGVPAASQPVPDPPAPERAQGPGPDRGPDPDPGFGVDRGPGPGFGVNPPGFVAAPVTVPDHSAGRVPEPVGARYHAPRAGGLVAVADHQEAAAFVRPGTRERDTAPRPARPAGPDGAHAGERGTPPADQVEFTPPEVRGWVRVWRPLRGIGGRRWTMVAVVVPVLLLAVTAAALAVGVARGFVSFNPTMTGTVVQFPDPYQASPGPPGISVSLRLSPSIAATARTHPLNLTLHVALTSASSTGDACVHNSQLRYTVLDHTTVAATGTLTAGQPVTRSAPLRLRPGSHDLKVTFVIVVPPTETGCKYTIDPSGTTLSKTR
jgi:hypothetical protein